MPECVRIADGGDRTCPLESGAGTQDEVVASVVNAFPGRALAELQEYGIIPFRLRGSSFRNNHVIQLSSNRPQVPIETKCSDRDRILHGRI